MLLLSACLDTDTQAQMEVSYGQVWALYSINNSISTTISADNKSL